ncbi:kinesin [Saccharibacillus sp. O23]|uniref:MotE family protein n=1 Tax=Saccharibacillus sp. O23 TaxID=2009338 RepID=UPI000B4E321A|nr:kinesin [Saccharibacillus sp. O23]OWR27846.1 kinesin [Saccharibacillus sp. O23]
MAKTEVQPEMALEEGSGSKAGRILLFAVPILFTIVLVGVLLTLLNPSTRNSVLETANKIPVVGTMLPKPTYTPEQQAAMKKEQQKASDEATIKQLKTQLQQKTTELNAAKQKQASTQTEVDSLKKQVEDAKAAQKKAAADQQSKEKPKPSDQVRQLAATYAAMSASKAAPILETLTNEEIAMVLNAMGTEQQSAILQKMTADKAAKISIMLKNATSPQQLETAANAARAAADNADKASAQPQTNSTGGSLNQTQLAQTFSSMDAASAATLLAQMAKTNQAKVLTILKSVDDTTRSGILSQMAGTDSETAAALANKLIGS